MDLVAEAGIDVSDWANYGGEHASANPKYCYDWSFVREGKVVVLNLWYSALKVRKGKIVVETTMAGDEDPAGKPVWTSRGKRFRAAVATAWEDGLPVRVILLDGDVRTGRAADSKRSIVKTRALDPAVWAVTSYDARSGHVLLTRGVKRVRPRGGPGEDMDAEGLYPDELPFGRNYREGERKTVEVNAIERDPRARRDCLRHHGYCCAACDLLFSERYGDIGDKFIHVHHLKPLSTLRRARDIDPARDLVPVCPNCHAMLHRSRRPMTVAALRRRIARAARRS